MLTLPLAAQASYFSSERYVALANHRLLQISTASKACVALRQLSRSQRLAVVDQDASIAAFGKVPAFLYCVDLDYFAASAQPLERHFVYILVEKHSACYHCEALPIGSEFGDDLSFTPLAFNLGRSTLIVGARRGGADWAIPIGASFHLAEGGWVKDSTVSPNLNVHSPLSMKFVNPSKIKVTFDVWSFHLKEGNSSSHPIYQEVWELKRGQLVGYRLKELPTPCGLLDKLSGYVSRRQRLRFDKRVAISCQESLWKELRNSRWPIGLLARYRFGSVSGQEHVLKRRSM